jgi:hypothetical protein
MDRRPRSCGVRPPQAAATNGWAFTCSYRWIPRLSVFAAGAGVMGDPAANRGGSSSEAQGSDRLHKAGPFQFREHVLHCAGWVPPGIGDLPHAGVDDPRIDGDLVEDEIIRRFDLDIPRLQFRLREVFSGWS